MSETKLQTIHHEHSMGTYELAMEINVGAGPNCPDLDTEPIRYATYDAAKLIKAAVMKATIQADSEAMAAAAREKQEIISLFPSPVFVEEIPNGYCKDSCCAHRPWFVVTTTIGRFEIGWRKRVIHIDWSGTVGTKSASELFPDEDTTKEACYIHAWSLEKAAEYIKKIQGD